jgi:hypothetical protein
VIKICLHREEVAAGSATGGNATDSIQAETLFVPVYPQNDFGIRRCLVESLLDGCSSIERLIRSIMVVEVLEPSQPLRDSLVPAGHWDQQDRNGYEELQRIVSSSKNV